jgi:hypothetical protein
MTTQFGFSWLVSKPQCTPTHARSTLDQSIDHESTLDQQRIIHENWPYKGRRQNQTEWFGNAPSEAVVRVCLAWTLVELLFLSSGH